MLTTLHKRLSDEYPSMTVKMVGRVGVAPTASWSQTKRLTPRLTSVYKIGFNRCCYYTKSVTISRPMKRNSRLSQYLLQGCMSCLNCIHTNYLFFTSSTTSYMMATSKPTYLLKMVRFHGTAPCSSG